MQTNMPIGYKMINGKIVIDKYKSKTVCKIFYEYVGGKTIFAMSKELTLNKVPNGNNKTNWTHGAVGRILENVKYLGDDIHPKLIDQEMFDKAAEIRAQRIKKLGRNFHANSIQNENIFSNKVFCGNCGEVYRIYVEHSGNSCEKKKWKCKKYIYKNKAFCKNLFYTKEELTELSLKAINMVIVKPKLLDQKPKRYKPRKSDDLVEVERQIEEIEEEEKFASPILKNHIFKRAVLTYNESQIDSYDVHTSVIKEVLADTKPLMELEEEIFSQIIDRITIYEDGKVKVQFISGVTITEQYKQGKGDRDGNN